MRIHRKQGFTIIEAIVYLGVIVILLNLSFGAFFQYDGSSRSMRRNAADIERALQAGERWRSDLRQAVKPPRMGKQGGNDTLVIPLANGEVVYWFQDNQVWRKAGTQTASLLKAVKASAMTADVRQQVTAWRWEMELATTRKNVTVRPLFTFEGVAPYRE